MTFLNELVTGQKITEIYLCKRVSVAKTKAGKDYWNVTLQDKTGTCDGKVWDPNTQDIGDFNNMDYIEITAEVTEFNGATQLKILKAKKVREGEYNPANYMPTSDRDIEEMYAQLMQMVDSVKTPYLKTLLLGFFGEGGELRDVFKKHSAAKSVHHAFIGGLLEHTLSVAELCDFYAKKYDFLNRDLLITAAICHDMGKTRELSSYPENDYTDEGQLLGHIYMGAQMVQEAAEGIEDFPEIRKNELVHCILSHHGKLEFGSPKVPALAEALALSQADNTDAKMETIREALYRGQSAQATGWQKHRFLEANIRKTWEESNEEE